MKYTLLLFPIIILSLAGFSLAHEGGQPFCNRPPNGILEITNQ